MTKKQIVFRVPFGLDSYVLAEELRRACQSQFVSLDIHPTKIVVKLYGDSVSVERSISYMKAAYKKVLEKYKMISEKEVLIPKDKVASLLGFPLSVDVLKDTFQLLGIPFTENNNEIRVKISYQKLIECAKKLFDNYVLAKDYFTGAARRVASVASVILNLDINDIAKIGETLGVFKKINDKYMLSVNPQSAYEILIKIKLNEPHEL